MKRISVRSPCSSANLGSGFDSFGLALEAFHDTLTIELTGEGIEVEVTGLEAKKIPSDPERNTAGLVAKGLLKNRDVGVRIQLHKGIPLR
ncbi:MAG TPA: homoserine kinase, partial [Candidatus Bathyarchaeota archaeon]|nr:homoserine kinase [Candidatus Bathyarchaeota archaeon]